MSTKKKKRRFTKKEKRWAIVGLIFVLVTLIVYLSIAIPYFKERKRTGFNKNYKYDGVSLVGKWQEKDSFSDALYKTYDFQENGRVIVTMYVYGMKQLEDLTSTYRIENKNTLVISYSVAGVVQSTRADFSINDDGKIVVLKNSDKSFTTLEEYNLTYNLDTSIYGEWVNNANPNEIYTFNQDYTGKMTDRHVQEDGKEVEGSNRIVYSTKGDTLYFFVDEYMPIEGYGLSAEFVLDCKYKVEGNTLTVTMGDKTNTYTRK